MLETFDFQILSGLHSICEIAGGFFNVLAKVMTFIGENGIWLFALSAVLMAFAKTRKIGVCLFGAVACGAMISNIILKENVERIRPYLCDSTYHEWWIAAGEEIAEGFSFPSGHATAAAAGMTALALIWDKRSLWVMVPYVLLMAFSRMYLMVHYPTDVIAGVCIGIFSGVVAYLITLAIYAILNKFSDKTLSKLILTDIDAGKLFRRKNG